MVLAGLSSSYSSNCTRWHAIPIAFMTACYGCHLCSCGEKRIFCLRNQIASYCTRLLVPLSERHSHTADCHCRSGKSFSEMQSAFSSLLSNRRDQQSLHGLSNAQEQKLQEVSDRDIDSGPQNRFPVEPTSMIPDGEDGHLTSGGEIETHEYLLTK